MEFVDLKSQYTLLKRPLQQRINDVLEHGRFIMGPEIVELEQRLAEYVGSEHCVSVSSGTDALLIAMMALGVGAGDEVITSPFTFIATGEMIALLGAKPVFVDIDHQTYNINPALIEAAISPRTKAIMPVSLYGQCADFDEINKIVEPHGIPVVEDAAQSFGATYRGAMSCALSTIGCTSFFPSKPLGCYGDGGACFTNDADIAKQMREIRVHGQDRRYHHPIVGLNGRMDTLQAAILLAKFDSFPDEVAARARIGARYSERIAERCPGVTVPFVEAYNSSVFAQYTVRTDERDQVLEHLKQSHIPTAVHYPVPLHLQPAFQNLNLEQGAGSMPVSELFAGQVFSLPMHPFLEDQTQDEIINALATAPFSQAPKDASAKNS
jgi:UDP-2-acetamido-2-deoxy-ribo-hexuluronate aminotransferase